MPIILAKDQAVSLGIVRNFYNFSLEDGKVVRTTARQSSPLQIPVTEELVKYLKSCGNDAALVVGQSLVGPTISVGFQQDTIVSRKAYLRISRTEQLIAGLFPGDALTTSAVKLKLDFKTLDNTKVYSDFKATLTPTITSHFFTLRGDGEGTAFDATVNFNSTPNDEALVHCLPWNCSSRCSSWKITMSLSLSVSSKATTLQVNTPQFGTGFNMKMLLSDKRFCDVTVFAASTTGTRCHRNILAAHSSVFADKFQADIDEGWSSVLKLDGMSDEGCVALINYMYSWETSGFEDNPAICVELLVAADMYKIRPLKMCVEEILLKKTANWYTPHAVFRLFLFLNNLVTNGPLKMKTMQVFKQKFAEVEQIPEYKKLWKESPDTFTEVLKYFAST